MAEVLLQRTRADAVAGVWSKFVHAFGAPEYLAAASEEEIALVIEPLGLARKRAGYLKDLGRALTEIDTVTTDPSTLLALPGVGPYSAAAFLTSWRGTRTAPVDANIRRVIGRVVLGIDMADRQETEILVRRLLARGDAAAILHAVLDFGASPCRPRRPLCEGCPAGSFCLFWQQASASAPVPVADCDTAR
jgi:A/G-specific adenine glycosylase